MFCNLVRTGFVTCQSRRLTRFTPTLVNRFSSSNFINNDNASPSAIFDENADESDTFGTLDKQYNEKIASNFVFEEDDNDKQDEHERKVADIYRPGKADFLRKINELVHDKKDVKAALEVLDVEMRNEYVQPEQEHYRILIHACAMVGYTNKAFKLHREFKNRDLPYHVGIYTDLFSACTKSKSPDFAREKAKQLLNEIREKHINPNRALYNSMIQAFGRLGDLPTAFNLVDEMKQYKWNLTDETYNFLLQGCLSDKESGFRHALIIWRNMRRKKISPTIYSYNLMLRCTKECGMGDPNLIQDILLESVSNQERKFLEARLGGELMNQKDAGEKLLLAGSRSQGDNKEKDLSKDTELKWWEVDIKSLERSIRLKENSTPSILDANPDLGNVLEISMEDTPEGRMSLIGNLDQLEKCMAADKVLPDMKTFSILLTTINTPEMELQIFKSINNMGLQPDTALFNQMIKNRAFRKDRKQGIETLSEMSKYGVAPDIITFGCLALCCSDRRTSLKLLKDMHSMGAKPNVQIMDTFLNRAYARLSVADVQRFLVICENERIPVNKRLLDKLEVFYQKYRSLIKLKESGGSVPRPVNYEATKENFKNWREFSKFYPLWLERIKFDQIEDPMAQYKTTKDIQDELKRKEKLEASK